MDNTPAFFEIFRAGKHVAVDGREMEFTDADVAEIASTYSPDLSEAPLVVGHPEINAPAYGWTKTLRADKGLLFAAPHQVDPEFAGMVNAGRFKKRSASLYLRDTPGNPTPGKLYLRHIGFLGAAAPAVKGLKDAQFADGGKAAEFAMPVSYLGSALVDMFQRMRDWFVETQGAEKADQIIPQWQIRSIDDLTDIGDTAEIPAVAYASPATPGTTTETTMSTSNPGADFAEREANLNSRQAEIDKRDRELREREDKARRDDAVSFADHLVKEGRLLPPQKAPVVELLLALPAQPISFAEGGSTVSKPGSDVLRELLGQLPKQINYREKSGDDRAPVAAVSFAAPQGEHVDAAALELHAKAVAYQAQHSGMSYLAAVKAVGG